MVARLAPRSAVRGGTCRYTRGYSYSHFPWYRRAIVMRWPRRVEGNGTALIILQPRTVRVPGAVPLLVLLLLASVCGAEAAGKQDLQLNETLPVSDQLRGRTLNVVLKTSSTSKNVIYEDGVLSGIYGELLLEIADLAGFALNFVNQTAKNKELYPSGTFTACLADTADPESDVDMCLGAFGDTDERRAIAPNAFPAPVRCARTCTDRVTAAEKTGRVKSEFVRRHAVCTTAAGWIPWSCCGPPGTTVSDMR